jgi:hypothetical protein
MYTHGLEPVGLPFALEEAANGRPAETAPVPFSWDATLRTPGGRPSSAWEDCGEVVRTIAARVRLTSKIMLCHWWRHRTDL